MTSATQQIVPIQRSSPSHPSERQGLASELAKCLKLVAPAGMGAEQQTVWLHAAVDALEDIRASEVAAVSAEIARLVAERRKRGPARAMPEGGSMAERLAANGNAQLAEMKRNDVHWIVKNGQPAIEWK
jgi:hypothetical protein